ncbi:winged helix-turn-helix domain-containing protein [Sphaerotilus natans]|uniref:winged helix-turn-helix domain-containing protein n=1 Tax=Sphaerotilus natans TaxID=34103 RepID=UPI00406C5048
MQGANRTLSSDDEALLRHWIIQDRPATHGLPYALWTRRAVQELIRAKFDTDMPIRTVGEYLMRWVQALYHLFKAHGHNHIYAPTFRCFLKYQTH